MPALVENLAYIARFCCLTGLIIFNGFAYYDSSAGCADSSLLFFNFSAGIYLTLIYPGTATTRQVVPNESQ